MKPFDRPHAWRRFIEKACTDRTGSAPKEVVDWLSQHHANQGKRVLTYAQVDAIRALGFNGDREDAFYVNQNAARAFHLFYSIKEARDGRARGLNLNLRFMCSQDERTCAVAKSFNKTVVTVDLAPELPLIGCDAPEPCRCMYSITSENPQ